MRRRTHTTFTWSYDPHGYNPVGVSPVTSISDYLFLSDFAIKTVEDGGRKKGYQNRLSMAFTSARYRVPDEHKIEVELRLANLLKSGVLCSRLGSSGSSTLDMQSQEIVGHYGSIGYEYMFHLRKGEIFCDGALRVAYDVHKEFMSSVKGDYFLKFNVTQVGLVHYNNAWITQTDYLRVLAKQRFRESDSLD